MRSTAILSCLTLLFSASVQADTYTCENNIPPRLEWDNNEGYCGEVSLISACLYYGQYISQYDVRALISQGEPQNKCQLLVGINDQLAISPLHLNAITWNTEAEQDTDQFVTWVKQMVVKGYPISIGIYMNQYRFYGNTKPDAGDPDYDHIVPVFGFSSNSPLTNPNYFGDDIFYLSDNGLWGGSSPPYFFSYTADNFQATRTEANAKDGDLYSLPNTASNYGTAITGIKDLHGDTLPIRLSTNVNYEKPEINNGSNQRPAPMPLELTVTLSHLQPGVVYHLYCYNDLAAVPDSHFNAHAASASKSWQIHIASGSTYSMTEVIQSNEIAVYRAVKATAP
jgi:hypothetical protein